MSDIFSNAQLASYGDRIQIFGLGSDWDTKTILEAELNILQLRQQPYETKKADYESEKQTWTSFQTSLQNFNGIVENLKNLNTQNKDVTLSDDGYVSVTATGSALDSSYSISIQQTATKHRLMGDQIGEGPLGITETVQLNGQDLEITADMDLKGIAKAINDGSYETNAVVLDGRLVLTSKQAGPSNTISFSNSASWETLGLTQGGIIKNELQSAQAAKFTVNGVSMESESNTYTEIEGLTINLLKETTSDIEMDVNRSSEQFVDTVKSLVEAYNKVITNINTLSGEAGILQGESIPRNLKRQMNNLLFSIQDSGTMLYQLGITLDKTAKNGTLSLDESKLKEMLDSDPSKVSNLLTGSNSFSGKLFGLVEEYSKTSGTIQNQIDGLNTRIERINDTLERYETQFEKQKESLILKYASFETQMSRLTSQNEYIQSMLGNDSSNK